MLHAFTVGPFFLCAVAVLSCSQLYKNVAFGTRPPAPLAPLFSPTPKSALQLVDAAAL